ncbi:P-loop containing nucleoside triphosphate hydrolase protein [Daldinia eschscholtzii]|nr:P-loop containing nucleoside triphosphate hydrolase protein [Daldinia eschscholtzii]
MSDPNSLDGHDTQREFDIIKHHIYFEQYLPAASPTQEWRSYPEIPTGQDLNPDWDDQEQLDRIRNLLPNKWKQPWESKNTYLETHYRLQREEGITMLRHSIKKFKDDPAMMDDGETCIYTKVFVRGYLMTRLGPMCQVQFSTERSGKKIRWSQTRRLTVGTLVAISTAKDRFKTICMPAIISEHRIRDGLDQNPPTIYFQWANISDAVMDPNQELVMIETRLGYFEAVRHSMVGLQHVAATETSLDKYLVQADKRDLCAKYVEHDPHRDVTSLVHHIPDSSSMTESERHGKIVEVCEPLRRYSVLDGFDSQLSRYTNLDNSQLSAVHRILTKELAIVQGPPGTGKTFTSVQALRILLESQERGSNVIIVAAQTNHAVDQILIQLINAGFKVVRLGGRTQNEDIKHYSMYNLRQRTRALLSQRADRDFRTFESARKRNIAELEKIIDVVFPDDLLDPEILRSTGLITDSQFESLRAEQEWADTPSTQDGPSGLLAEWLGSQLVQARQPGEKDPEFDAFEDHDSLDIDLEDYDMELDNCIDDEDENTGRIDGKFLPIKHLWTGSNSQNYTEDDLVVRRDLQKQNLWDIDVKHRGAVYQFWQKELLLRNRQKFRDLLADNARIAKNLKMNRWYKDTQCIKAQQIEIIGCTTTGLCKYRGLLAALRPRTMLIEEAAETREANILSALYGSLEQLILVGDHQQLAPHCDTPGLGQEPYYMRVSMFERLVHLNMPFTVLNMQRRMIPALREILNEFYPSLQDHPVVTQGHSRPPIPGMAVPSFFFHHTWTEGQDENLSRFNILEAEMIIRFIDYLLMNGTPASQITVLTFYRGQKKKIISLFKSQMRQWAPFTNVFTVDSYQGEENDIVILSLVRSKGPNGPHQAGFLQDENRGVVSISRARRGFYVFGNMLNLAFASQLSWNMWGKVQQVFEKQGRFGGDTRLPITCQKHRRTVWMSHPEDWVNCHGGCDLPCPDELDCGHACGRRCHWASHDKLICTEPCERILLCGHRCQRSCGERCQCSCAEFTGAYPHDEFLPENETFKVDDVSVGYDRTHVAPFISQDQRRMSARTSGRGKKRGLHRGGRRVRDFRPGLGYHGGWDNPPETDFGQVNLPPLADTGGYGWSDFNANIEDEKTFREPITGSSSPLNRTSIQDIYRPVTLDNHGLRSVGKSIIARTSPPLKKSSDDLLTSEDHAEAIVLGARSLDIGNNSIRANALDSITAVEHLSDMLADPTTSQQENVEVATPRSHAGVVAFGSHLYSRGSSQPSSILSIPVGRRADKPEWESLPDTETSSIGRMVEENPKDDIAAGSRSRAKEDDLITF